MSLPLSSHGLLLCVSASSMPVKLPVSSSHKDTSHRVWGSWKGCLSHASPQVGPRLCASKLFCFQDESGTPHAVWSTCAASSPAAHTLDSCCVDGQSCCNLGAFANSVPLAWNALHVTQPLLPPSEKRTHPLSRSPGPRVFFRHNM